MTSTESQMYPMNGLMIGLIVSTVKNSLVHSWHWDDMSAPPYSYCPNHVEKVNADVDD